MNPVERLLAKVWRSYLYRMDQRRSKDVDVWVANSNAIKEKIGQAYGKEAVVVYPPVDLERFDTSVTSKVKSQKSKGHGKSAELSHMGTSPSPTNDASVATSGDYFFVVSRLGEYKRVDVIVEAFNRLGWPLKVVGRGPQAEYLKRIAKPNVEILDALPDEVVTRMYHECRAFVIAANEDFGITPVEAMACGKPVIALGQGGFLETVIEGETGTFFPEQSVESLVAALQRFDGMTFDPARIRKRAEEFGIEAFKKRMGEVIKVAVGKISGK
jgi:glycosyltransferase involved in cell wall biosynthesis